MNHTDEAIEHWGDRFVTSGISDQLSFDQFMELTPAQRERRLSMAAEVEQLRRRAERTLPATCRKHDQTRVAPIRRRRWPWFFRTR